MPNHRTCLVNASYFCPVSFKSESGRDGLHLLLANKNLHQMSTFGTALDDVTRKNKHWNKKLLPLLEFELIASSFPLLFYHVMLHTHPTFPPARLPSGSSLTSFALCVTRWEFSFLQTLIALVWLISTAFFSLTYDDCWLLFFPHMFTHTLSLLHLSLIMHNYFLNKTIYFMKNLELSVW